MWKLIARGERGTPFEEIGTYADLNDAAMAILKMEEGSSKGAILFHIFVLPALDRSDATLLSSLAYQSDKHYYVVTRNPS
jgi:hypothetical protein